jgi:hypothetical protein
MYIGRFGTSGTFEQGNGTAGIEVGGYQQDSTAYLCSAVGPAGTSQIHVLGTATLEGTWKIQDFGAGTSRYTVMTAGGGIVGAFDSVTLPSGWSWGIDNGSTLWVQPIPEPATLSLLALGGLAVLRRRRLRR